MKVRKKKEGKTDCHADTNVPDIIDIEIRHEVAAPKMFLKNYDENECCPI